VRDLARAALLNHRAGRIRNLAAAALLLHVAHRIRNALRDGARDLIAAGVRDLAVMAFMHVPRARNLPLLDARAPDLPVADRRRALYRSPATRGRRGVAAWCRGGAATGRAGDAFLDGLPVARADVDALRLANRAASGVADVAIFCLG